MIIWKAVNNQQRELQRRFLEWQRVDDCTIAQVPNKTLIRPSNDVRHGSWWENWQWIDNNQIIGA